MRGAAPTHGMTGSVPYYGGRRPPTHIYGIEQSARQNAQRAAAPPPPAPLRNQRNPQAVLDALGYLRDTGVITPREFGDFRARAGV
jgi:hypothetical protein